MQGQETGDERGLTEQEAFDLLSSRRRRLALSCLAETDGTTTIGELSTMLAARENDVRPGAVSRRQRKRAYTALRQSHLPRMADAGVVAYDPDRGTVEATPLVDELQRYLDREPSIPWSTIYAGVVAVVVTGAIASAAGAPLVEGLPWHAWALTLLVGVGSLTAARLAAERGEETAFDKVVSADSRR